MEHLTHRLLFLGRIPLMLLPIIMWLNTENIQPVQQPLTFLSKQKLARLQLLDCKTVSNTMYVLRRLTSLVFLVPMLMQRQQPRLIQRLLVSQQTQ